MTNENLWVETWFYILDIYFYGWCVLFEPHSMRDSFWSIGSVHTCVVVCLFICNSYSNLSNWTSISYRAAGCLSFDIKIIQPIWMEMFYPAINIQKKETTMAVTVPVAMTMAEVKRVTDNKCRLTATNRFQLGHQR